MQSEQREERADAIALEILTQSRNSLMVNFRFLDRAISRLTPVKTDRIGFGSDGIALYYNPWVLLGIYCDSPTELNRDLMHTLLHCIFRHNLVGKEIDMLRWDLACDIAVEHLISEFCSSALAASRAGLQGALISVLNEELDSLTAERIYRWLSARDFSDDEMEAERENFRGDSHGVWYGNRDENSQEDKTPDLKKIWEEVSKRMQTELETMQSNAGTALVQNLRQLNRTRRSYTEFLRRFGIHSEVLRLSEEEFDQNYYTFGLELYGNIPLLEPLEYSEDRRIREFVIAVDTSGSVRGDVVQSFLQHTCDILHQQECFTSRVNIRIMQCDSEVRADVCIHSLSELEDYLTHMQILGLGKTDFRPVFRRIEQLQQEKELINLQGLIYFTDGDGIFPAQAPAYDTAFILHGPEAFRPELPPWAMQLSIREEDILDRRFSGT